MHRQIVLDTETTGVNAREHRIVEIGCVELIDRKYTGNHFHVYINPQQVMDQEVINVHGLTNEYLADKPLFADVARDFFEFIKGAELVIHNAPFDVGFMDMEFGRLGAASPGKTAEYCEILDTLVMAREKHPGQKNNLDALCKRYFVDNSKREKHGALLDAEILAEVYLAMTGGQTMLWNADDSDAGESGSNHGAITRLDAGDLTLLMPTEEEQKAHDEVLALIEKKSGGAIWNAGPGSQG